MALPVLNATFASAADLPRRQMLAKWLVNLQYSGSIEDYYTLPEKYIYAKIAVASGAARSEYDYTSLPDRYILSDIYKAVSGSSADTIDRGEKEALGWIAAAVRGDAGDPIKVATYINLPWRYQVASIITALAADLDAQSFVTTSGATDIEAIDQFVKGVKNLGLWSDMVCWPLRSSQNAGTGTTAYSLGGLGTYNGTLTNGPTWGADGIFFADNTAQYVLTTFTPSSTDNFVIFSAHQSNPQGTTLNAICACRSPDHLFFSIFQSSDNFERSILWSSPNSIFPQIANITNGSYNTSSSRFNISAATKTVGLTRNTEAEVALSDTVTVTATPPPLILGAETTTNRPLSGNLPFVAYLRVSSFDNAAFRSLYKSTLGTGLSLP